MTNVLRICCRSWVRKTPSTSPQTWASFWRWASGFLDLYCKAEREVRPVAPVGPEGKADMILRSIPISSDDLQLGLEGPRGLDSLQDGDQIPGGDADGVQGLDYLADVYPLR